MSESREIDSKHGIRRKNWPFWQCCWGRALRPTIATAEPDGRAQGSIGSRSSPISGGFLADLTNSDWRIFKSDLVDLKKIIWQRWWH
jgi:hypothetical protein